MDYIAEPLGRVKIRQLAEGIRKMLGLSDVLYLPVARILEIAMPLFFKDFSYEIVPEHEMPRNKHADTDVVNRIIRIREDVYYQAVDGSGRDRMTIMHEIAHYFLIVVCGIRFARTFGKNSGVAYLDPEWQAKALAGEIMCPSRLIGQMTARQISISCGVSMTAAELNLRKCRSIND